MSTSSSDERRSPIGDQLLATFDGPDGSVTFDDLAATATREGHGLADAMLWLATAQAGDVVFEAGSPGERTYHLTERGQAILADDPRRREPTPA